MNSTLKIVVLDGHTLNPGDLKWDRLKAIGNVSIYKRTLNRSDMINRCKEADIVLTNKTIIDEHSIDNLPKLKYIGVLATGYNVVDVSAAFKRDIVVTNIPDYSSYSVAQLTFALILELCMRVGDHKISVDKGDWYNSKDFSYWKYPLVELYNKTIGIIGFGNIGNKVADIASGFGMNVVGYKRNQTDQSMRPNFRWSNNLDELLSVSDIVSLHCPLSIETNRMVDNKFLNKMKRSAILINTSRGGLINEKDLALALNSNQIRGAGLDVLSEEPPKNINPLIGIDNCIITPHVGWASLESRMRLMDLVVDNILAYLRKDPVNVVGL